MTRQDHPTSMALASAALDSGVDATAIREHLKGCLACRVRMARLEHSEAIEGPHRGNVVRILEASTPGPEVLGRLLAEPKGGDPGPGQLWRVGRDEALLVWVRGVLGDSIDVIPAVLDVDLADQQTVLLPSTATPLGMELALMTGVRAHIHRQAFLQYLADVDAMDEVNEAITAASAGREPQGISVGPPIESANDQRLEYRQVLADLLTDLGPSMWDSPGWPPGASEPSDRGIFEALVDELPQRHVGALVTEIVNQQFEVDAEHQLHCYCKVSYLDTSVIVTVLVGPEATSFQEAHSLAKACLEVAHCEPDGDAVAVAVLKPDWPTVLMKVSDMRSAYEPPSGEQRGPRILLGGLGLIDLLAKYFDLQSTAWETTEGANSLQGQTDVQTLAAQHALSAVAAVAKQGGRALTQAKKSAWTNLPSGLEERIAEFIVSVASDEPIDSAISKLMREVDGD